MLLVSDSGGWWCCLLKIGTQDSKLFMGRRFIQFWTIGSDVSRWKFIVSVWEEDVDVIGFQPTGDT